MSTSGDKPKASVATMVSTSVPNNSKDQCKKKYFLFPLQNNPRKICRFLWLYKWLSSNQNTRLLKLTNTF